MYLTDELDEDSALTLLDVVSIAPPKSPATPPVKFKNFTTSCSVILGTLISIVLFDFRPTLQFGWGSAIVIGAAYLYAVGGGASAPVEKEADAARRLLEESEAGSPEGSRADSRRSSIESV